MPSTYTTRLNVTKQGTGDNSGTWGAVLNDQTVELLDEAIAGVQSLNVTTGSNLTLSVANGATSQARKAVLRLTGTPTANIAIIIPSLEKTYDIDGTGFAGAFTITVRAATGAGVAFTAGQKGRIYFNGTDVINLAPVVPVTAVVGDTNVKATLTGTTVNLSLGITGGVIAYAGSSAPAGWLLCAGQAVSRTTFADLFAVTGTTYGVGDGSTTFNLPDLRGRVPAGKDDMNGSAANRITNAIAGFIGTVLGAFGGDQNMHQHTHTATVTDPGHTHGPGNLLTMNGAGVPQNFGGGTRTLFEFTAGTSSATTGITVGNANAGTGTSQNVQPTLILNYIIKT
jgi:microcystin-dependent protein